MAEPHYSASSNMRSDDYGQKEKGWKEKPDPQENSLLLESLSEISQAWETSYSSLDSAMTPQYYAFINTMKNHCICGESRTRNEKDCDGIGHM